MQLSPGEMIINVSPNQAYLVNTHLLMDGPPLLKGQKISKAFFLETPLLLKTDEIFDKILPYEARAEFFLIFWSFGGNGVSKKMF